MPKPNDIIFRVKIKKGYVNQGEWRRFELEQYFKEKWDHNALDWRTKSLYIRRDDKAGKQIFEGDVLELKRLKFFNIETKEYIYDVQFGIVERDGKGGFRCPLFYILGQKHLYLEDMENSDIMGNIHNDYSNSECPVCNQEGTVLICPLTCPAYATCRTEPNFHCEHVERKNCPICIETVDEDEDEEDVDYLQESSR